MRSLLRRFNADPAFQYKLHLVMAYFWATNFIVAIATYELAPRPWAKFSILYLLLVSLYANFATDYGAVAAAVAAKTAAKVEIDSELVADRLDDTTTGGITTVLDELGKIEGQLET
jgi:hypothetical protein